VTTVTSFWTVTSYSLVVEHKFLFFLEAQDHVMHRKVDNRVQRIHGATEQMTAVLIVTVL
jgi:hypothetical protein